VLLVHSDPAVRQNLAATLQSAGISLTVAERIAEVERWPKGDVVITEEQFYTPFWHSVGAAHVVVISDQGRSVAGDHKAVTVVPATSGAQALLAVVDGFRLVAA
jgi:CheY-like chemotaxis protein